MPIIADSYALIGWMLYKSLFIITAYYHVSPRCIYFCANLCH